MISWYVYSFQTFEGIPEYNQSTIVIVQNQDNINLPTYIQNEMDEIEVQVINIDGSVPYEIDDEVVIVPNLEEMMKLLH